MIVDNQSAVIKLLKDPATYGMDGPVEVIETHISMIFLVGDRAFKLKRAVKLPYVDFSTPERRLETCRQEVKRNSITASRLYIGVRRITKGNDGCLALDGAGALVDAVVEMVRFGQELLLDRMAESHLLNPAIMTSVAAMIADFHASAEVVHETSGSANIAAVLDINAAGFATSNVFTAEQATRLDRKCRKSLARLSGLLDRRERLGKVRLCHGDLHLRNICLLDGQPRLFDCIEFNDQIASIDTLYDLAFLLMDLWHRDLRALANLVMNRYLDATSDEDGFVLLPFFMAVRAAVRAHVLATQVEEANSQSSMLVAEARAYYDLALNLLDPVPAGLVIIGGLSGSGKTTVAELSADRMGAPPGARILESDRIRKAMHGVSATTKLPLEAYRPEISQKVYANLAARARMILLAGGTVLAEAVFDRRNNRDMIQMAAIDLDMPVSAFWLHAGASLLKQRVNRRGTSPSDANEEVLARQLSGSDIPQDWVKIDAALPPDTIASTIAEQHASKVNATENHH